jgi:hypothetical protein
MLQNRLFIAGRRARFPALFIMFCLLTIAGCEHGGRAFIDDHQLDSGLVGNWVVSGEGWSDNYAISSNSVSHPDGFPPYHNAVIEYVYNFNETSGCIIVRYTDSEYSGKYSAVYFKNLSKSTVLLGDAYDTRIQYPENNNPSVDTLDEAKLKFRPENASVYGGADAQTGTPQTRQG